MARFGDPRAVEPMLALLSSADAGKRQDAARALGQFKDERILDLLLHSLKDGNFEVRLNATSSLGRLGDVCAVEALQLLLEDPYSETYTTVDSTYFGDVTESHDTFPVREAGRRR